LKQIKMNLNPVYTKPEYKNGDDGNG